MSDQPWMKFYPRDWRGDQALRAVSIAARGLWVECLCIMHEARPYGHLLLNGNPVGDDTLARMTGIPMDEVSALMAELRQAGVLSVTGKGVVFSRRMTKDHARARKGQKAAHKRWSQVSDGVEQSGAPNRSPNGPPTAQSPEARVQTQKREPGGSPKRFREGEVELRDVLGAEIARAVVDHRIKLRKPLTPRAAGLLAQKFAACPDPRAAADAMISNGWQGFEPGWMDRLAPQAPPRPDPGLVTLGGGSAEFEAVRAYRAAEGKSLVLGQSGQTTVEARELAKAMAWQLAAQQEPQQAPKQIPAGGHE